MATLVQKIESELCTLMGETGKLTLQRCLRKLGKTDGLSYFERVALIEELSKTFAMIMPEEKVGLFRLKLSSLKGDDEQ